MLRSNCKYQCSSEKGKCQEQLQPCMHTPLANHVSSGQTGCVCGWVAMSGQGACTAACINKKRRIGWAGVQRSSSRELVCACRKLLLDRPYTSDSFWLQHMEEVLVPQWADWAGGRGKGWKLFQADTGQSGVWHREWPNHTPAPTSNAVAPNSESGGLKTNNPGVNT